MKDQSKETEKNRKLEHTYATYHSNSFLGMFLKSLAVKKKNAADAADAEPAGNPAEEEES